MKRQRLLVLIETDAIELRTVRLEKILQLFESLRGKDLVWAHAHAGVTRIVAVRISRALHVSKRISHGLHAALTFTLNEAGVALHPGLPRRMHLRLLRADKGPVFILKVLGLIVSRSSQFEIVVGDGDVSFLDLLSVFLTQLIQTALRFLLSALHPPLGNFLLIAHRSPIR